MKLIELTEARERMLARHAAELAAMDKVLAATETQTGAPVEVPAENPVEVPAKPKRVKPQIEVRRTERTGIPVTEAIRAVMGKRTKPWSATECVEHVVKRYPEMATKLRNGAYVALRFLVEHGVLVRTVEAGIQCYLAVPENEGERVKVPGLDKEPESRATLVKRLMDAEKELEEAKAEGNTSRQQVLTDRIATLNRKLEGLS